MKKSASFGWSLKFAGSLIFPKAEKQSLARKSLFGAVLCIGLSLVPLIVVTSITNGMIDGMTERIVGLSSSHIQAYVAPNISRVQFLFLILMIQTYLLMAIFVLGHLRWK